MLEEITVPKDLITTMYAEILHLRFITQCLVRKLEPGKVPRLQPFDLLEDDLLSGYMKRAEMVIDLINDPIWNLMMNEVEEEEVEEPITEEIVVTEQVDLNELDLGENIAFYSEKTVDLSRIA